MFATARPHARRTLSGSQPSSLSISRRRAQCSHTVILSLRGRKRRAEAGGEGGQRSGRWAESCSHARHQPPLARAPRGRHPLARYHPVLPCARRPSLHGGNSVWSGRRPGLSSTAPRQQSSPSCVDATSGEDEQAPKRETGRASQNRIYCPIQTSSRQGLRLCRKGPASPALLGRFATNEAPYYRRSFATPPSPPTVSLEVKSNLTKRRGKRGKRPLPPRGGACTRATSLH